MKERTLVLIKPDGIQHGHVGEILHRFEQRGIRIMNMRMLKMTEEMANAHYRDHLDKPFFEELKQSIMSGPIIALVLEAETCILLIRKMVGATNPLEAAPGTIRGDFSLDVPYNTVHASDNPANAEREIRLFFGDNVIE